MEGSRDTLKDWTERLKEVLAEETIRNHTHRVLTLADYEEFVADLTKVPDFPTEFTESSYEIYLDKIHQTGHALTDKLRSH